MCTATTIRLTGLALTLLAGVQTHDVMAQGGFPTSRDPLKWPFAQNSIWNMPIGSGASYSPAGLQGTGYVYVDDDVIIMAPTAPLTEVRECYADWNGGADRCRADGGVMLDVPIPTGLLIPQEGGTPNMAAAVLKADGRTIHQSQPFHRCVAGNHATSHYAYPDDDIISGNGIQGAHGGSGMSSLGGTLRMGELVPGGVIRHALKMGLYAGRYLRYNDDGTRGYRWPAVKADGYAEGVYNGSNSQMEMGVLLALKPDFNVSGLRTEPARILAKAYQDYGCYVTDDTYWDATQFMAEWGNFGRVADEFRSRWGYDFNGEENSSDWTRDMGDIMRALNVVTNSSSSAIGGGGTPRVQLAPPFSTTVTRPSTHRADARVCRPASVCIDAGGAALRRQAATGATAEVYDLSGKIVARQNGAGGQRESVSPDRPGSYVVKWTSAQ